MTCCLQGEQTCLDYQEDIFMEMNSLLEGLSIPDVERNIPKMPAEAGDWNNHTLNDFK